MPTGYTADIAKGITFKEYAMGCARAFAALVAMRDEPTNAEIPEEFKPSAYHLTQVVEAKDKLSELKKMSNVDGQVEAEVAYNKAEATRLKRIDEIKDLRIKYEQMLAEAKKYKAPTKDHENFRQFMIDQIVKSSDFDCTTTYYDQPTVRLSGAEWLNQEIEKCHKDIEYHERLYDEECQRVAERNAWVKALRESLK